MSTKTTPPKTHVVKAFRGKAMTIDGTPIREGAELTSAQHDVLQARLREKRDAKQPVPEIRIEPVSSSATRAGGSGS